MNAAWAAMCLALLSCGPSSITYYVDDSFSPAEVDVIQRAADDWSRVAIMPQHVTRELTEASHVISQRDAASMPVHGVDGVQMGRDIILRRGLYQDSPQWFRAAVHHEMGHALGLVHLPRGEIGAMSNPFTSAEITAADLAQCYRRNVCRVTVPSRRDVVVDTADED